MFGLRHSDVSEMKQIFSDYPVVETVIIFGSRAMGNYSNWSDVDIALKGNRISDVMWKIKARLEEESSMPYFSTWLIITIFRTQL